jgi:hypothetical protein
MGSTQGSASRGGREPKSTNDLARSAFKKMGGGTVSPETRAAIAKKMAQGLRPDNQVQTTGTPASRAQSRFAPRSPAVRTTTTSTPKVAPKPNIPEPKVQGTQRVLGQAISPDKLKQQRALGARSALGEHGTDPRDTGPEQPSLQRLSAVQELRKEAGSLSMEGKLGGQFMGGHGIETDELFGGGRPGQLK